jgi:hypothetical protein
VVSARAPFVKYSTDGPNLSSFLYSVVLYLYISLDPCLGPSYDSLDTVNILMDLSNSFLKVYSSHLNWEA